MRCRIVSEHGWADLVGPTICRTLTPEEVRTVRSKLGPDPLNPDADPEQFYRAARKSSRPIGVILMDQAAISGVGNIFRAESLYRQEIDPLRPGKSLSDEELQRLWEDNKHLLVIGVRVGRIITTEPEDRPGVPETEAWPDHANYVYMHHGEPCRRCGTTIRMEEIAGRNSTGARCQNVATGGEEQWLRLYWWWMFRGVFCIRSYRLEIMMVRKRRCRRLWRISAVQGAK